MGDTFEILSKNEAQKMDNCKATPRKNVLLEISNGAPIQPLKGRLTTHTQDGTYGRD